MPNELPYNIKQLFADKVKGLKSIKEISIDPIYQGCAQMARVREVGGPVGYGIRACATSIIKLTKEQDYSVLSANDPHPELIEEQTLNMISSSLTDNPATCERFESFNKGGCNTCSFKGKIKSPMHIAVDSALEDHDSKPSLALESNVSNNALLDDVPILKVIANPKFDVRLECEGYNPVGLFQGVFNFDLWRFAPFSDFIVDTEVVGEAGTVSVVYRVTYDLDSDRVRFAVKSVYDVDFLGEVVFDLDLLTMSIASLGKAHVNPSTGTKEQNDLNLAREVIGISYQECLMTIHSGCEAKLCRLTDKQKAINKKRVAKGKKPLYEETLIRIKPSVYYKPTGSRKRYTPTCAHQRRGHFRTLQSGKKVWVRDCKVSEGHARSVKHNYVFEYEHM